MKLEEFTKRHKALEERYKTLQNCYDQDMGDKKAQVSALKAENERLTTKDFLLREKIRILEEKPNPVSVGDLANIVYLNIPCNYDGTNQEEVTRVLEKTAQALYDRIYGEGADPKHYYPDCSGVKERADLRDKPKVICDELPSGKGLLIKNPDFSEWKRGGGEAPDEWVAKHDKPEDNNLINLLDSVLPIVETWNAETPAQKEWKENILKQIKGVIKLDKPKEYCQLKQLDDFFWNGLPEDGVNKALTLIARLKDKLNEVIEYTKQKGV